MVGEPRVVWMPGGVRTEVHLVGEETDGAFCLLLDEPPAAWALPAHSHRHEAETIHVVRGEFELVLAGERHVLAAGETVHVPRGVLHASANIGADAGRRIVVFSPAGMERFFLEAGAATPAEVDPAAALAAAIRHGWEFTGG